MCGYHMVYNGQPKLLLGQEDDGQVIAAECERDV